MIGEALANNTSLTDLSLECGERTKVKTKEMIIIFSYVQTGNSFGNLGGRMIIEAMKTNTTLTLLNVGGEDRL